MSFGVVGGMQCPASYANKGFGESNAFFWYVLEVEAFFICMRVRAKEGVAYEVPPNYDSPGFPFSYWNEVRHRRLPQESQVACLECYPTTERGLRSRGVTNTPELGFRDAGDQVDIRCNVNTVNNMCVDLTLDDSDG